MNKVAQVVNDDSNEAIADPTIEKEALVVKQQTETEIRMKLDEFAKELRTARKQRGDH